VGALSTRQVYAAAPGLVRYAAHLRLATRRVFAGRMEGKGYLSVMGLAKVIDVFDDMERERLRGIDYAHGTGDR